MAWSDETCVVVKKRWSGSDTVICGQSTVEGYLRQGYAFDWKATDRHRAIALAIKKGLDRVT